jgi:hypothetical protein
VCASWTQNGLDQKRAASLFAYAGRCHAKNCDNGENEADDFKLLRCGEPHVWSPPAPIMLF